MSEQGELTRARFFKSLTIREVPRSQINAAAYNPRLISAYARKQLQNNLKSDECVEPLVWNERTANLVGGHQRLSLTDEDEGFPGKDYLVPVSVVSLDLRREKQLNVRLNNRAAQGNFDQDLFQQFMADTDLSLDDLGFTKIDLDIEFGGAAGFEDILERGKKAADPIKRDVQAIKDRKKEYRGTDNEDPQQDADYYLMVCFNSGKEKAEFMQRHGFRDKFVSAAEFFLAANDATCPQSQVILDAINRVREIAEDPQMKMARAMELIAADFTAGAGVA